MPRRLLNIATVLSLLYGGLMVLMWIQSFVVPIDTKFGTVRTNAKGGEEYYGNYIWHFVSKDGRLHLQRLQTQNTIDVSYPILLFIGAVFPLVWLRETYEERRQRLKQMNLCKVCGYDLRASPDRCPECGTVHQSNVGSALADGFPG